jgi:hypothetical protein
MKLLNLLMLPAALILIPVSSSALLCEILNTCSETPPAAVPEPSGALVMGIALVTVALAGRRQRR